MTLSIQQGDYQAKFELINFFTIKNKKLEVLLYLTIENVLF